MIFDNRPLEELNEENDLFGLLDKAKLILSLFNNPYGLSDENKMFAIYGGWGTGKTTLLRYLEANLDKNKYHPIFFEAWQNEKDDNLALSLSYKLRAELKRESTALRIGKKFIRISSAFLRGFAKSTTVRLDIPGLDVLSPSGSISIRTKDIFDEVEKSTNAEEVDNSFSELLSDFKSTFNELEAEIIKQNGLGSKSRIIIFVDDLDRCEPENVLNLISAIKLFFTYQ